MAIQVDLYKGSGIDGVSEIVCGGFSISATSEVMRQFARDVHQFFLTDTDPVVSIILDADLEEAQAEDDYDGAPEEDME